MTREVTPAPAGDWRRSGWYDLGFVLLLIGLGLAFLRNGRGWGAMAYIGNQQYGDADFWWQGALQFSYGMVWDNINITFRMGYAVLTGLFVAILGPNVLIYHKLLCLIFLAVAALSYFTMRRFTGRATASAFAAVLVFAPYQAEWLAISTSDGTGLIWNLLALLSLILALLEPARTGRFVAFGIFLALGGLTRPLMALFIGPALLLPWLASGPGWRRRLITNAAMLFGFALPMLVWMAAYYHHTGTLAVAGHDSTAFYAASDPTIQVWRPDMYPPVEAAARAHNGGVAPNPAQLSQEFWRQAITNYRTHAAYHLNRIIDTVLVAADFRYEHHNPPATHLYTLLTQALLALLAGFLVLEAIRWNRLGNALAVAALAALWFGVPAADKFVILAVAVAVPLSVRRIGAAPVAVAAYWWAGVAAFYLTGGTNGPPVNETFALNALGYRLGSQFFFANDWLVVLGFWLTARLPLPELAKLPTMVPAERRFAAWTDLALQPRRPVTILLGGMGTLFVLALVGVLAAGAIRVGVRGWRLNHEAPVAMPEVAAAQVALCAAHGREPDPTAPSPVVADPARFRAMASTAADRHTAETLLVTGSLSALIWQMPTQQRTTALFFQQAVRSPYVMTSDHTAVEISGLVAEGTWRNRQGLWLLRSFPEAMPRADYVYYESHPQVQAFIPFDDRRSGYAVPAAVWFPLSHTASELVAAGALTVAGGRLDWQTFPSGDVHRRWFILMPAVDGPALADRTVTIALGQALGRRTLQLEFRVEPIPGRAPLAGVSGLYVEAFGTDAGGRRRLVARASPSRGGAVDVPLEALALALPDALSQVELVFHDVGATEMVRVMELKVIADDFAPSAITQLCRPGP